MRNLVACILSLTLLASGVMAAENSGPLAPGKPAGVKHAQGANTTALVVITGIVVAGLAIGLATASSGNPGGPVPLTVVPSTTS